MKTTCTCSVLPLYCEEQSIKPKSWFGCTNEEAKLQRLLVLNHTTGRWIKQVSSVYYTAYLFDPSICLIQTKPESEWTMYRILFWTVDSKKNYCCSAQSPTYILLIRTHKQLSLAGDVSALASCPLWSLLFLQSKNINMISQFCASG